MIELARAGPEDAAAFARVAAEALLEPWTEAGFRAQLSRPETRAWSAHQGAETVGFLVTHRVLDELQVLSLAVAEPFRRRGTGRALLEQALASERGVREIHLEVRSNDAAAQAFYRNAGFGEVGRRRGFYAGGVDALLMRRVLWAAPRLGPPG